MTYIPSTQAFYSYFSTNYRGTQWICSSKYIFFGQIFARAGRLGKNAMSLEGTCCWEIVNSGCLRRFRKDVAMQLLPLSLTAEKTAQMPRPPSKCSS